MAYRVIESRIAQMGFCCPYSYFVACQHTPTPEIAEELKVHRRSVRRWRVAYREGTMTCAGKSNCFFIPKKPVQRPYVIPARALDLDLTPDVEHSY